MSGSPGTRAAPDLPPGPRSALIIATTQYNDPGFRKLRAPADDAQALAEVLRDPAIGSFNVTTVVNADERDTRRAITRFLSERVPDETVLVYLSCHGVPDKRNRLYFAATDTRKEDLSGTGVAAAWLTERLEDECQARQQVLILDCCFSGAFANGAKGHGDLDLQHSLPAHGRGRVVLTASRGSEYSFEGEALPGITITGSVFTAGLIEGLRTGKADTSGTGQVTVDDAYDYTCKYVRSTGASQTPTRWVSGGEGSIILARNPVGKTVIPAPLPADLAEAIQSRYPEVRLGGVRTIGNWLTGSDPARAVTAEQHLREIAYADTDIPAVTSEARKCLEAAARISTPAQATAKPTNVLFAAAEGIQDMVTFHEEQAETAHEVHATAAPVKRGPKSVTIIYRNQLIPDGADITLELETLVRHEVVDQVKDWLAADSVRTQVTWSPHPSHPLRWAMEPNQRWTPTSLRNEIFRRAGLPAPTFSAADAWCYNNSCLYVIAHPEAPSSDALGRA